MGACGRGTSDPPPKKTRTHTQVLPNRADLLPTYWALLNMAAVPSDVLEATTFMSDERCPRPL